jgi:hypothetical protein
MPVQAVAVTAPRACNIADRSGVHGAASASFRKL